MENDWVKVYSSNQLYNVELLRHLLSEKGITSIVLNQRDSMYVIMGEINLMVKRDQVIPAKKIITDSGL